MDADIQADIRREAENDPHMRQKIINEEYKIWKKNSPYLYDMLYARAFEWPTLTCQWFPDVKDVPDTPYKEYRLLVGTATTGKADEFLRIIKVEIPTPTHSGELGKYLRETGEAGGHGQGRTMFHWDYHQDIRHPGEVNKARYMPQNPNLIASMSSDANIYLFDRTKHPLKPKDKTINPQMTLEGHTEEGFGLDWNRYLEGRIVTGAEDEMMRVWDVTTGTELTAKKHTSSEVWEDHKGIVNEVLWHPRQAHVWGSVSDDRSFILNDDRNHRGNVGATIHSDSVNCFDWHPRHESNFATGCTDGTVAIWDIRRLTEKLYAVGGHRDSVISIAWAPVNEMGCILASCGYDRRVNIWDISKCGKEQSAEEASDGPPELLFMHGGFTNRVCDFAWLPTWPWVIFAAADDNQCQIFKPAENLVKDATYDINPQKRIPEAYNHEVD